MFSANTSEKSIYLLPVTSEEIAFALTIILGANLVPIFGLAAVCGRLLSAGRA
jgi:hypothetical protein